MSELINTPNQTNDTRWHLLSTVSSLALAITLCTPAQAASDTNRPTVWIELGAQLDRLQGGEEAFLPPFLSAHPRQFAPVSSAEIQRPPRYAFGGEGKITFQPDASDWSVSAAIRYGRSNNKKQLHQQTTEVRQSGLALQNDDPWFVHLTRFGDTASAHKSGYLIADFMAGRDVGVGLWGRGNSTTIDFGVRFAQFTASSTAKLRDKPDPFIERIAQPPTPFFPSWHKYKTNSHNHSYYAHNEIARSFSGVGPTLSINGSQEIAGNVEDVGLAFDWGVNAAVLFGRQKVNGSHKSSSLYFKNFGYGPYSSSKPAPRNVARTRSVAVPNVGGFAGASLRFPNAKLSLGYRADFFFGAMDGRIDKRDTRNQSFHGPFATISLGLG
ncbi:MAG TPA: hypothetical protein VL026_12225 [Rhizomicrobium sp.]|nr:hypothetical protein [Rhizomicrobium sp.]